MASLFPDVVLEFSPTTDPLEDPVWEDITPYLRSFSTTRGRSNELNRVEAGVATFVLDNWDGRFDPTKTTGPYYPGVRPMRRVRITAYIPGSLPIFYAGDSMLGGTEVLGSSDDVSESLFSGFVEGWSQDWNPTPAPNPDQTATLRAVDAFRVLGALVGVTGTAGQIGVLIGPILDHAGWPAAERNIEPGVYSAFVAEDSNGVVLAALLDLDAAEGGAFFIARDGKVTFYDSAHVRAILPDAYQTWGDLTAERQYQSITIVYDETTVWNHVVVTGSGVPGASADDRASQAAYMRRDQTLSTSINVQADCETRAWEFLSQYSVPAVRVTELEVAVRDDLDWPDILSHDLLDRIVVRRRPSTGHLIEQDSVIQGITIDSPAQNKWSVKWRLSAVPTDNMLTPNQSSLDTDTTGWTAVTNCSIARATDTPAYGTGRMRLLPTAGGDASAETTPTTQLAVIAGQVYSATAGFYAQASLRNVHVEIIWRNGSGTLLSSSVGASTPESLQYVHPAVTAVAPVGASFATVRVVIEAAGASEDHRVDTIGFFAGEHTGWSIGRG